MKTRSSSKTNPSVASAVSQASIDPQLRQGTATGSAPSHIDAEHTMSATDGHSTGIPASDLERDQSGSDDEEVEMEQDVTEDDENSTQPNAATQTVAGIGQLATMHGDRGELHAGSQSYMQPRHRLTILNDDYADLINYNTTYVCFVYHSMTTAPTTLTKEQTDMLALLTKRTEALGDDADQFIADLASMMIQAVYWLHVQGDHLFDAQFKRLKPRKEDSTMTATERVEAICDILHNHKKHVVDLMEGGYDAITKFAAAPKGIAKRKANYQPNNRNRKVNLTVLRDFAKSQGKTISDLKGGVNDEDGNA